MWEFELYWWMDTITDLMILSLVFLIVCVLRKLKINVTSCLCVCVCMFVSVNPQWCDVHVYKLYFVWERNKALLINIGSEVRSPIDDFLYSTRFTMYLYSKVKIKNWPHLICKRFTDEKPHTSKPMLTLKLNTETEYTIDLPDYFPFETMKQMCMHLGEWKWKYIGNEKRCKINYNHIRE